MAKVGLAAAVAAVLYPLADVHAEGVDEPLAVLVIGSRASLATAQDIKRDKLEIVDSIVAEDIGKLPDFSVTDAIQRVTGVQVARDRGDGTNVAIRGLTQVETTLNGREIFTAWTGRNLDYADIPAEMLAGIDVYKTSSAHQLEGGIGGLVDLRTRRPFDFAGPQAAATVREVQGDLVNQRKNQYSALLSNRWKSEDAGEFGALLSLSFQDRAFREDWKTAGVPVMKTFGGQQVIVPNGGNETTSAGTRKRNGASVALQWRPRSDFDLYAEGDYAELRTVQNSYQLFASGGTLNAATLSPGTSNAQNVGWTNALVTTAGAARDMIDRTSQFAIGGTWFGDKTTVKTDVSYTKSHNDLLYTALVLSGATANLAQDLSGKVPDMATTGGNLLGLGSFANASLWYSARPFDGELKALRLDLEHRVAGDFVDSVSTGLRSARRHATDAPGQTGLNGTSTVGAANAAGLVRTNPYADFFPGSTSIGNYLAGNADTIRSLKAQGLIQALGMTATLQTSNPLGTWDIREDTDSLYAMATIRAIDFPLDGNIGVRLVRTTESVSGYRGVTAGSTVPNDNATRYVDRLPSANARYELTDGLFLRAAASKTMTRPDFNQIAPSLTLNNIQFTGTAGGNPDLHPVRSDNRDIAIERHFGKSTLLQATLFTKKVDGFLINRSAWETYDGVAYNVTRPYNAEKADVKGAEIGYQQFYDFLPGWLSGLGLQANYTYVDSSTRDLTLKQEVPLQNLSKNSFNLIGMYERGPVSARLAYNWRGKFLAGVNGGGYTPLPVYVRDYGWLDGSFSYRVNNKLTLSIEGNNLLRTVRRSYYGTESRPADAWINDRQIVLAASLRY